MKPAFIAGMILISAAFAGSLLFMSLGLAQAGFCRDGETRICGSNIGQCRFGTQACAGGFFGPCQGGVRPDFESCDGRDNDCDGVADNDCGPVSGRQPQPPQPGQPPPQPPQAGPLRAAFACGNDVCERGVGLTLREGQAREVIVNGESRTVRLDRVDAQRFATICVDSQCQTAATGRALNAGRFSILVGGIFFDRSGRGLGSASVTIGEHANTCPADCPRRAVCGNAVCEIEEDARSCRFDCRREFCGDSVCSVTGVSLRKGGFEIVKAAGDFHTIELLDIIQRQNAFSALVAVDSRQGGTVIREGEVRTIRGVTIFARDITAGGASFTVGENQFTCPQDCKGPALFTSLTCRNAVCENRKFSMREREARTVVVDGQFRLIEVRFINPDGATLISVDSEREKLVHPGTPERIHGINIAVNEAFVAPRPGGASFVSLSVFEDGDTCPLDC